MDAQDEDCFALDGVVAEMVIEVEDCQKSVLDEYRNLSPAPLKNNDISEQNHDNNMSVAELDNIQGQNTNFSAGKEDKENCQEISVASDIKKDDHADKSNRQIIRRKRKRESILDVKEDKKDLDSPRYPDRKRQANKKYISEESATAKIKKAEAEQLKEAPEGIKRRKLDAENKDTKVDTDVKDTKKKADVESKDTKKKQGSGRPSTRTTRLGIEIPAEPIVEPKEKKDVLRKLPFRKNKDAPEVLDLKPKILWWNGVGEGQGIKLGDILEIRDRIISAKSCKALFRVIYFQWPANNQEAVEHIFKFNGFPFDKTSFEYIKRQNMMRLMFDKTIANICDMLGLEKDSDKNIMVTSILDFLLKPQGKLDPSKDLSMQPVVLLERIKIDSKFFTQLNKDGQIRKRGKAKLVENIPVRTTRNSTAKMKELGIPDDIVEPPVKPKDSTKTPVSKAKPTAKEGVSPPIKSGTKPKNKTATKEVKPLASSKAEKAKTVEKTKPVKKSKEEPEEKQKSENSKSKDENDIAIKLKKKIKRLKKKLKKSNSLNKGKITEKKSSDNDSKKRSSSDDDSSNEDKSDVEEKAEESESADSPPHIDVQSPAKEDHRVRFSLSDSSETESSDETKMVAATQKKVAQKRVAKPLKHFPKIGESIQKANFSALQRLHILLFGASDKAENLKGNILAFGGFPFLEGSDDWKQKHFLLSLLAHNNLREYLNLLCIEYSEDDQPGMINKLMRFLACPSENLIENKLPEIETEVVHSELINNGPSCKLPVKENKVVKKKKAAPKKEEKKGPRHRKVLMSEEEARRLEANFAREQRAIARESKAPPPVQKSLTVAPVHQVMPNMMPGLTIGQVSKPPMPDPSQLNALLQTVYRRRALKAAGAVVSTPNKGEKVRLGDIENVKFLIVTSNYQDLEYLHRLIFMFDAFKSKMRKNILDFDGFGFNEDSMMYKERMDYLKSLGYDLSKRISFLLGLCPLQTTIPQQDLNELIMYFLMSPCKTKQVVPITQMPMDPSSVKLAPGEMNHMKNQLVFKPTSGSEKAAFYQNILKTTPAPNKSRASPVKQKSTVISKKSSSASGVLPQKAKKSISSSSVKISPVKTVLLPPPGSSVLTTSPGSKLTPGTPTQKIAVLNPIPAVSTFNTLPSTTVLSSVGKVLSANPRISNSNTVLKVPFINSGTNLQVLSPTSNVAVVDPSPQIPVSTISTVSGTIVQNAMMLPQTANKIIQSQSNTLQSSAISGKSLIKTSSGLSPQEFIVQQQTPDGQQKTFKLIRLPPNHPLASAVSKPAVQEVVSPPSIQQQPVFISSTALAGGSQPSGFILMKNPNIPVQNVQNIVQSVPMKIQLPSNKTILTNHQPNIITSNSEEFVLPDEGQPVNELANNPSIDEVEILNPLEDSTPPSDDDLFSSIQEIILSSNFEDITLRNVIERVSAQFPNHDLTHRHNFMKECVKKIIIGTS